MSDRREAGNAAFPGPQALIEPFLADPFAQLVQGEANYVSDIILPEAVYLEIIRSPLPSGLIKGAESAAPENPLGARGAGEAGVIGAGAAIADAVADAPGAAGERVRRLPLRPEDVLVTLAIGAGQ